MSQPPLFRVSQRALVALCLVALQLAATLHFSLVSHSFNGSLNGFVHVHQARRALARLERPTAVSLVADSAGCVGESCPVGFAGQHSVLLGSSEAPWLIALTQPGTRSPDNPHFTPRSRVLLSAPKTSPPV